MIQYKRIYLGLDYEDHTAKVVSPLQTSSALQYLDSIEIPANVYYNNTLFKVRSITPAAFVNCCGMSFVSIPDGIEYIGRAAFAGCNRITGIYIPGSVTHLGNGVFDECSLLERVFFMPNTQLTCIPVRAFSDCVGLTYIALPDSITLIRCYAFYHCCSLTSLYIPYRVEKIEEMAFADCYNLTSITLPKSITEIGKAVFAGCENLQTIRVPQGMKERFCKMGLEPWRDKIVEI